MARMQPLTIRLGKRLREALGNEAEREGVSLSQYVRDAALARMVYARAERGEVDEREMSSLARSLSRPENDETPPPKRGG